MIKTSLQKSGVIQRKIGVEIHLAQLNQAKA